MPKKDKVTANVTADTSTDTQVDATVQEPTTHAPVASGHADDEGLGTLEATCETASDVADGDEDENTRINSAGKAARRGGNAYEDGL